MPRSLQEIDAEIAKVKAEIANRDVYSHGFSQPQTKVGWGSYIVNGDRGLLDQYQGRENQWKNTLEQQDFQNAERAWQQKFQAEEAKKNRKHAEKLAKEQRLENSMLQMDENMKSRANAAIKQQYAQYDLKQAEKSGVKDDIERAKMNLALANNELNYWNNRVGYTEQKKEEPTNETGNEETKEEPANETVNEEPKEEPEVPNEGSRDNSMSVPVKLVNSKNIKRFKTRADRADHIKKLEALDPYGQSEKVQGEINRIKGLDTDEDKAERKKAWDAGMKLQGYDYRKWKDSKAGKKLIAEFGE